MDNFYWILGLTPDTATIADIKANYRKLAKRWHPDHDHSAEAAEMFLKLKEAYETLSDPERKAEYDRKYNFEDAANGRESPFIQTIVGRMRGAFSDDPMEERDGGDASFTVEVDFATALHGEKGKAVVFDRERDCPKCHGWSSLLGRRGVEVCRRCHGARKVTRPSNVNGVNMLVSEVCPDCGGTGRTILSPCPMCNAMGRIVVPTEVRLDIPAGVGNGTVIRVVGMGHMGHLREANGDFYATVRVLPDKMFHMEGHNIFVKLKVPVERLMLGGEVEVPLPTGGFQKENVPPCRPGHWSFAIAGHGMPIIGRPGKRGSLVVKLEPEFPDILNEVERETLERYAEERKRTAAGRGNDEDGQEPGQEEADNL
jgi:molecular chaperone DnaJ